jgi:hypothetical protein
MSANRFLQNYAAIPSVLLVLGATAGALYLREFRAPFIYILCGLALLGVAYIAFLLRAALAWWRARRSGAPLPKKLTIIAMFVAGLAIWGAGLGGPLLFHDGPPYFRALDQTKHELTELVRTRGSIQRATSQAAKLQAMEHMRDVLSSCDSSLDELRLIAPRYRLACLISFIGVIASLMSVVLVCCRMAIGRSAVQFAA